MEDMNFKCGIDFKNNLHELRNFHFSFLNPLFWVFLVLLFWVLLRLWYAKKSFSFCFILALILLATTKLEYMFANMSVTYGEKIDFFWIRICGIFAAAVVFLYYAFIKES